MKTTFALLPLSIAFAACSPSPNDSGNTDVACRPIIASAAARPAGWQGTVFTIVMENKSLSDVIDNPAAPYISALAHENAIAAGYHDSFVHPSEPNYIWMTAGENFGILDDSDPGLANTLSTQSHIADQIESAGLTWRTYQESMGAPCGLISHGTYAVKHNPFAYYRDINGWNGSGFSPSARCAEHVVDYAQLDADLASGELPDYVFITPNLIDDMHDGTVADGDTWLSHEVPKLLASSAYRKGGALFLLWDEGSDSEDDPPLIVVSPNVKKGFVSLVPYDTSSYLKTVETLLGVESLPCQQDGGTVKVMSDLFAASM
ncbi:MAG TPA: alkaline phosphatase family protein [Polyangiaceae bacterium]